MADQSTPYRDLSTPFWDLHGYGSSVENTPASDASAFSMDSSADLPSSGFLNDPSRFFDASANSQFSPPISLLDVLFLEASSFDINTDDPFLTSFSEQHTDFTNRLQFPQHSDGEDELYSSPSPPITTIAPAGLPRQPLPAAPQVELSGGMSPLTPGSSSDRDSDRDSDGEQVGGGKYVDREEPLTPTRFREVVRPTERDQGLVRDATKRCKSAAQTAQSAPTDTMPPPPPPPPLPSDGPQTRRVLKKHRMLRADSPSADHVRSSTPPRVKSSRGVQFPAEATATQRAAAKSVGGPLRGIFKKASEAPSAGSSKNAGLHKQPPKLILPPQPPAQAQDGRWVRSSGFLGSGRRGEKNVLARSLPPPPPLPVATPPPAPIAVAPPPPNIAAPPLPVIAAPPLPIAAAPPAPAAAALPLPNAAAAPLSVAAGSPQPDAAPPPINERRTPIPPERFISAIDEFVVQGEFVSVSMASPPPDWVAEHTKPPSTPPMTTLDANDKDDFVPNLVDPDADASDGLDVFEEDPENDFDDESPDEAASRTAMEIEELGERIKGKVIFPPFFPPPPMPPLTTPHGGGPTNDEQARVRRCFERMMAVVSRAVNSTGFLQTHIIKGFLQYAGGFKHCGTNLWNIYQIYANTLENRLAETQRLHPNFVWPPPPSGAPDANIKVDEFPPKLFPEELSITFKKFKMDYPDSWRDILCTFNDVHTAETLESAAERENPFHSKMDKVHGSLDAFNRAHGFEGLVVAVGCHMHEDAHIWDFYKTPGLEEITRSEVLYVQTVCSRFVRRLLLYHVQLVSLIF
ncbi:hypothetical protein C8R43DRAFT_1142743 [Mycena crocata]|nr:hypothetical protein C8R43DRAFT_1142743 [Mycena crocata]